MKEAIVTSTTRRYVEICKPDLTFQLAKSASHDLEISVGDLVQYQREGSEYLVHKRLDRKNVLVRSYGAKRKTLAANLDHLFIIAAVGRLFNKTFIDRISATAIQAEIPFTLVLNKIDLEEQYDSTIDSLNIYKKAGFNISEISVKHDRQIDLLREKIEAASNKIISLCGISGVGKSSLLNALIPGAEARTQQVSKATGQGKQTTTQSYAHIYSNGSDEPRFIIDTPGVQNFGIAHLTPEQVKKAFYEIDEASAQCRFANCMHRNEPDCAVREALNQELISVERYRSYCSMLDEIAAHSRY